MFQEMCFEDDKLDLFPRIQGADGSQKDYTKPEHLSITEARPHDDEYKADAPPEYEI